MAEPIELRPEDKLLWVLKEVDPNNFFKFANELKDELGGRVVMMSGPIEQMIILRG